jgi:hypothetical protein
MNISLSEELSTDKIVMRLNKTFQWRRVSKTLYLCTLKDLVYDIRASPSIVQNQTLNIRDRISMYTKCKYLHFLSFRNPFIVSVYHPKRSLINVHVCRGGQINLLLLVNFSSQTVISCAFDVQSMSSQAPFRINSPLLDRHFPFKHLSIDITYKEMLW